jgi:hypothetical protein
MKTNHSITITPPEGYTMEINSDKITFIQNPEPEHKRVRSFKELETVEGWYINTFNGTAEKNGPSNAEYRSSRDIWPTKELAEAALELCQLLQIRKQWIKDWHPDWDDEYQEKHCIVPSRCGLRTITLWVDQTIMSFPDYEMADDFLNTFKTQLEIAKPLL